jgi:hypothetical protein
MNRVRVERSPGAGEPVHVWPALGGSTPTEFVWRGRHYRVRALEPALSHHRRSGGVPRRFRVRTTSGLSCVLSHDGTGGWRIDRLIPTGAAR